MIQSFTRFLDTYLDEAAKPVQTPEQHAEMKEKIKALFMKRSKQLDDRRKGIKKPKEEIGKMNEDDWRVRSANDNPYTQTKAHRTKKFGAPASYLSPRPVSAEKKYVVKAGTPKHPVDYESNENYSKGDVRILRAIGNHKLADKAQKSRNDLDKHARQEKTKKKLTTIKGDKK